MNYPEDLFNVHCTKQRFMFIVQYCALSEVKEKENPNI